MKSVVIPAPALGSGIRIPLRPDIVKNQVAGVKILLQDRGLSVAERDSTYGLCVRGTLASYTGLETSESWCPFGAKYEGVKPAKKAYKSRQEELVAR